MASKPTKISPEQWTEQDRNRIGHAREVLQSYGQYTDVAEMSDVAYEKRNCRMKALDLTVATVCGIKPDQIDAQKIIDIANELYDYIWEGRVSDGAV